MIAAFCVAQENVREGGKRLLHLVPPPAGLLGQCRFQALRCAFSKDILHAREEAQMLLHPDHDVAFAHGANCGGGIVVDAIRIARYELIRVAVER